MKKIILLIASILLSVSCANNANMKVLEATMERIKEKCPFKVAEGLTITDAYVKDKVAVEVLRFDKRKKADFDSLQAVIGAKSAIIASFRDIVKADEMVHSAVAAKAIIRYIYNDNKGEEIYRVDILPKEYLHLTD